MMIIIILIIVGIIGFLSWNSKNVRAERTKELKKSLGTLIEADVDLIEAIAKLANNLEKGDSGGSSSVFIRTNDENGKFTIEANLQDFDEILDNALLFRNEISNINMDDSIEDVNERFSDFEKRMQDQRDRYRHHEAFWNMTDSEFNWVEDAEFKIDPNSSDDYRRYIFDKDMYTFFVIPADKKTVVELLVNAIHERLPNADIKWGPIITYLRFKGTGKVEYKS